MAFEERHGAHVLFDEILRVAPGHERQEQHQVHVVGELHGGAGK